LIKNLVMTLHKRRASSSKRTALTFSLMAIVTAVVWWLIAPISQRQAIEHKITERFHRLLGRDGSSRETRARPDDARSSQIVEQPMPPAMMLSDEPSWANALDKQRFLEPVGELTYKEALHQKLRLEKIVDLEIGGDGLLYALHAANMRVYVFTDELTPVRNWPLRLFQPDDPTPEDRFLEKAVALACGKNEIVVAGEKGELGRWRPDGTLIGEFSVPYSIRHVRVFPNGDFLLVTPGDRFLLHRISPKGMEKLAFAARDSANSPTAKVFDRAMAAILPEGDVAVSYEYPYRLEFYDPVGNPITSISLPLSLMLSPPEIDRDRQGNITRIFRQIVAYDLQVGPDSLIYHLVRLRGAEGGNQWDVFSTQGELLQRFYLPYNQRAFCFSRGAVYVLGAYPDYKLEKFLISKLTSAEQLGEEWRQKIQRE
jgi:hypothetical protein